MTKRELVDRIQELAWFHLGHRGLRFDNYMNLNKAELERRCAAAERMHELDIQVQELRAQHTEQEWHFAAVFPLKVSPEMNAKRDQLNELMRAASDIWISKV